MKKNITNKKFNIKIYDDYNAPRAWMKCKGVLATVTKKIQSEFENFTDEDVKCMIEDCLDCGRIDMSDYGDVGYDYYCIDVTLMK